MISVNIRRNLDPAKLPEKAVGWDCEGQVIMPGDTVAVVEEEEQRRGDMDFFFCSVGARGIVEKKEGLKSFTDWTIIVGFPIGSKQTMRSVGCADIHLRKV